MIESRGSSKHSDKFDQQATIKELEDLREENSVLKAAIKALTSQKKDEIRSYDKDIADLRDITDSLKVAMKQQQQEMNVLKAKIKECGEEYKKLYLEKLKLERKLLRDKSEKTKEIAFKKDVFDNKDGGSLGSVTDKKPVVGENNFDISNLPSMPPFPMHK